MARAAAIPSIRSSRTHRLVDGRFRVVALFLHLRELAVHHVGLAPDRLPLQEANARQQPHEHHHPEVGRRLLLCALRRRCGGLRARLDCRGRLKRRWRLRLRCRTPERQDTDERQDPGPHKRHGQRPLSRVCVNDGSRRINMVNQPPRRNHNRNHAGEKRHQHTASSASNKTAGRTPAMAVSSRRTAQPCVQRLESPFR